MTISIALSTIIYIMVFLFPGIIFRKAFFSGKFNNKFESGNQFERFLWNILTSIICIITFTITHSYINYFFDDILKFDLTGNDILETFICLYESKFPNYLRSSKNFITITKVIFFLYVFSFSIGWLLFKIVTVYRLDKTFGILDFNPSWDNIVVSSKINNITHKNGDITFSNLDIKTKNGDLFTGKLHKLFYNKEGKVSTIALKDTFKFYTIKKTIENKKRINHIKYKTKQTDSYFIYHYQNEFEFIYKKRIKGNIFTINEEQIENISITYVKINNVYKKVAKQLTRILVILMFVFSLIIFTNAFWNFEIISFSNEKKRVLFSIITNVILFILISFMISIPNKVKNKTNSKSIVGDFLMIIFFASYYLYIFDKVPFWGSLVLSLIIFLLLPKNKKEN